MTGGIIPYTMKGSDANHTLNFINGRNNSFFRLSICVHIKNQNRLQTVLYRKITMDLLSQYMKQFNFFIRLVVNTFRCDVIVATIPS